MDGNTTGQVCHTQNEHTYPWLAYRFSSRVIVSEVSIADLTDFSHSYSRVEVWVSDDPPTDAESKFTNGQMLGAFGPHGKTAQTINITANGMIAVGTYVIIQSQPASGKRWPGI